MTFNDIKTLWCNHRIKFTNGCAIIKNCAKGGNVHQIKNGEKLGDLEDCGGGKRGECFAWHEAASGSLVRDARADSATVVLLARRRSSTVRTLWERCRFPGKLCSRSQIERRVVRAGIE